MLKIKEQSEHACAEKDKADVREIEAGEDVLLVLAFEYEVPGDDHDARNDTADEQIDGYLPSPNVKAGIDQLVVACY